MKKIAKILASSLIGLVLALTATACSQLNCIEVGDKYTGEVNNLSFQYAREDSVVKYEFLDELIYSDVSAQILKEKDYDSICISYTTLYKTVTKTTLKETSTVTTVEETSDKKIKKGTYPLIKDGDKIYIEMENLPELVTYVEKKGSKETKTEDIIWCTKNVELTFDKDNLSFAIPTDWNKLNENQNDIVSDVVDVTFSLTKQNDKANE